MNERTTESLDINSKRKKLELKPWRICVESPFLNCDKVHPLQQKKVEYLLSQLKFDSNIKRIILFGSSVTAKCHVGSDVDLYLEKSNDFPVKIDKKDIVCDIWTNYSVDERLKKEILSKGVVIYERNII